VKRRLVTSTDLFFGLLSTHRAGPGRVDGPHPRPGTGNSSMKYLVRLDLDRIGLNLAAATRTPQTEEDILRLLATRKVWRRDEQWFTADESALRDFLDDEVLEKRPAD
jgi:hypothetical protein